MGDWRWDFMTVSLSSEEKKVVDGFFFSILDGEIENEWMNE